MGPILRGEPQRFTDAEAAAEAIVERLGTDIRVALPLGLGKPVTLLNALTRLACDNPDMRLTIFTALTLEVPRPQGLRRRFLEPASDRLFGAYPEILYARLRREGILPENIRVQEFFLMAGRLLGNRYAQEHYVPANYTHALDILVGKRPNLLLQLMAGSAGAPNLSCNTDISADLLRLRAKGEMDFLLAGERNKALPVLHGDAPIVPDEVAIWLDPPEPFELFSLPKMPVSRADHAISLHVAGLIPDGGTLQIGIGELGDAVAHAMTLRQAGKTRTIQAACPFPVGAEGWTEPFETGLYGVTEMLVDGMLRLLEAGIVKREVDGAAIHAGFFLECRDFYQRLRDLPPEQRHKIHMKPVSFTNALYGDEEAKRAARRGARFVNAGMKATVLGAVISDAVEDGQVVSGVGGQFNFVDQAFALEGGRSIITLNATRTSGGKTESNIVWDFPHCTIPWHMRDIIITEYGVADLRGKTDAASISAMIGIADSRFQEQLADKAKGAGKLPDSYRVPERHRRNTPEVLAEWLDPFSDALPAFPFGTDFDDTERFLLPVLSELKNMSATWTGKLTLLRDALICRPHPCEKEALDRMGFGPDVDGGLSKWALRGALRRFGERMTRTEA
ncbi:MAG: hypothetical protein NXH94_14045 [Rhodobacteraceae bacterium]|uniref:acetyl-CoA hydrolase/transferase C-terminal domain-containing protein n=1 Tax=Marivita sp. TaxID=2003365 RepID=UPI003B5165C5|nr:hypothetical protein [Paracoccaceae bacterium]